MEWLVPAVPSSALDLSANGSPAAPPAVTLHSFLLCCDAEHLEGEVATAEEQTLGSHQGLTLHKR